MGAEQDDSDPESQQQQLQLQDQQQHMEESTTRSSTSSSTATMSQPLSAFFRVLLEENARLADAELVLDRASILPDNRSKSCILLEAHSSSISSIPELSRWTSHIVKAPAPAAAAVLPPSVLEQTRERLEKDQKAAFHASPTRPQRRTSFEVDRSNDKLISDMESTRRALSQSLTGLSMLHQQDLEESVKRTLPPRAPIRRSSGRVQSPPPPDSSLRSHRRQHQQQEEEEEASDASFQLHFSESDHHDEHCIHSRRQQSDALSNSLSSTNSEDDTPRRPASYEDRRVRSSLTNATVRRSRSPRGLMPDNTTSNPSNHARHRRRSPPGAGDLPMLEGFSSQPHQRVLPQGHTILPSLPDSNTNNSSSSNNINNTVDKNKNDTFNTPPQGNTELHLTKVASSKVLPNRRSFDVGESTPVATEPPSPTTVPKPAKKTLLGRMKKTVKGKLKARGRSKSPVPPSGSSKKSPARHNSGETHTTVSDATSMG